MKLKKPTVTIPQTELESYVASMLVDSELAANDLEVSQEPAEQASASLADNSTATEPVIQDDNPRITLITNEHPKVVEAQEAILDEPLEAKPNKAQDNKTPELIEEENQPLSVSLTEAASAIKENLSEVAVKEETKPAILDSQKEATSEQKPRVQDLSEFVEEEAEAVDPRLKNVEKLLAQIALAKIPNVQEQEKTAQVAERRLDVKQIDQAEAVTDNQELIACMESSFEHRESTPLKESLGSVFQTLVFEVNQLPMAVPLVKLGGIVDLADQVITPLVGTPDWFLGLLPNERGNLLVVDTQRFLMPERETKEQPDYRFLIVLDDSRWAIACHSVDDAKNLSPDDIRWSARTSQRPWFAGMVVEYMSALIEVDELINMLADNLVE